MTANNTAKNIALPELLSSDAFEQFHALLAEEISSTDDIEFDASGVSRLTTPCAQLLASFLQTRNLQVGNSQVGNSQVGKAQKTEIKNASDAFRSAWSDLGLGAQFAL